MKNSVKKVIIMGAAGRDFHNFNVLFRDDPSCQVVAFTAYQIPNIAGRTYPPELAGALYPSGIAIHDESRLPELIREHGADEVLFAFSDIAHIDVMHRASMANAEGADFRLIGAQRAMLKSKLPVVSVCAVRTGCGKSQTSRQVAKLLREKGKSVVVVRHPMPYGPDLNAQRLQRFAAIEDLDKHRCTIEEREEYENHIRMGHVVYAGVEYGEILRAAEREAEIILWDGGNNDVPFFRPDLHIVLVDPLRPGHEMLYHPGETNLRTAQVVLVNKVGAASPSGLKQVRENVQRINPKARMIEADSAVSVADGGRIQGKKVLVIEDGPTLTHGGMSYGAAHVAAKRYGAAEIVDPRPYAVGSIKQVLEKYPHLKDVLPAMGYADAQIEELRKTIDKVPCDLVLVGAPFDLGRIIRTKRPLIRVTYDLDPAGIQALEGVLDEFLARVSPVRAREAA
ncbi:MAG: GTPase [Elusimicrobia bacterium]|nr:GTPase [Elusimicrobiota bacterium]